MWSGPKPAPPPAAGGGIIQVSRVGIRLYLSVGPGGAPAADFTIDSLTAQRSPDGRPMVLATVRNTGGRALDMNGTLELLDGPRVGSARDRSRPLSVRRLAIGDTEPVTIILDDELPAGPWDARDHVAQRVARPQRARNHHVSRYRCGSPSHHQINDTRMAVPGDRGPRPASRPRCPTPCSQTTSTWIRSSTDRCGCTGPS